MRNIGVLCLAATLTASAAAAVPVNFAYELIKGINRRPLSDLCTGGGDGNGPIFYDGFSVDDRRRALGAGFGRAAVQHGGPVPEACYRLPGLFADGRHADAAADARSSRIFPGGDDAASGYGCPGPSRPYSGRVEGASGITGFLGFTLPDEPRPG